MLNFKDIAKIFEEIELRLVSSLKRNLKRHKQWERDEGFEWSAWQAEKLRNMENFRRENAEIMADYTDVIDDETRQLMGEQFDEGERLAEQSAPEDDGYMNVSDKHFFGVNEQKMQTLMTDITTLEKQVETAALRMTDDIYRQTVNRVQLAMGMGEMTLEKAVDTATRDFLDKGINCIVYADGKRVNIADYVRMALRTTSTRATLQGQAKRWAELGYDTVMTSSYGMCSKTCEPWQGRVYIDDVYTYWNGDTEERNGQLWGKSGYCGKWFPLLSTAIYSGLFHPNCRHTLTQYIDGVTELPKPIPAETIKRQREYEQKQRALERKIRKLKRYAEGTLDPDTAREYRRKLKAAQKELREFISQTNADEGKTVLRRDYGREKVYGIQGDFKALKGSEEIRFDTLNSSSKIDKDFAEEYRKEYDSFTSTFGELPNLRGVNIAPYQGYDTYGGYNPQSCEITLFGVGGKNGKSYISQVALAEKKKGQWSTSSPYHSFRHELGHALQQRMSDEDGWDRKLDKIKKLETSLKNELTNLSGSDIIDFERKKLSRYGFMKTEEFISESIAEYANNPKKARYVSKTVVRILLGKE